MGDIINIGKSFDELSEKEQEEFIDKFFVTIICIKTARHISLLKCPSFQAGNYHIQASR